MKKIRDKKKETNPAINISFKKNLIRKTEPSIKKISAPKRRKNTLSPANISQQKKTEREMALLMNNTEESFVLIDADMKIVIYNPQFEKGYKKFFGKGVKKGESILNYAQPSRKKIVREIYQDVFAGKTTESEIDIPLSDGTTVTFLNKYKPATDEHGNIIGAFISIKDITEQKKAQQLLVDSEKRFKALVENGYDAVIILNAKGKAIYASPSIERVLGHTPAEALQTNMYYIVHPDHVNQVQKIHDLCLVNPGIPFLIPASKWTHRDGSWLWLEGTVTNMLHDPSVSGIVANFRDVNEKIIAENTLATNEKRFRALVENGNDAFVILNKTGTSIYASSSVEKVLGYTEAEALRTNIFDILHPDYIDDIQKAVQQCIDNPGLAVSKPLAKWLHKDGKWRWLEGTIINMLEDPAIGGIVDNFRDVTEKVQTEKKIREERFLFRTLIDNLPLNAYTKDLQSRKTLANQVDYEYAGFNSEEGILGKTDFELFSEESARNTTEEDKYIFTTGKSIIGKEEHHIKKDGSEVWFLISKIPLKNEESQVTGLVGISFDITERKKAEAKLARKEEQLSAATQIAKLGYWELDIVNKTDAWSDETYRIFGYIPGEVPPMIETYLNMVHPDDIDYVTKNIEESQKNLTPSSFTHRIIRKDGVTRIIYTESRFVLNKENKPIAVYGIHHDITEQRQIEETLKENKLSLQKAFDIAMIGSWKYDIANDRYEWTQGAIDVLGLKKEDVPINWKDFKKLIAAEDIDQFLLEIDRAQLSGIFDLEHRMNIYGQTKWVRAKSHVVFDKKGNSIFSIGIVQDITQRKLIEQQLNDAYNFNQTIIQTSPVGIWIYDETGQAISVNQASAELTGGTIEKLLTYNFRNIPSWKESGLYDAAILAVESGTVVKKEIHTISTFKKEIWFEALLMPVQFKGKKHLILMTYDIQDRMRAEQSLIQSEKQLSIAMQIARLGYWEFDVMEGLFTFNDQFYAMLKTTAEKARGYRLQPQQYAEMFVHPDDRALVGNEVANAITTTDPNFSGKVEHRVIFGDGTEGYISVNFYIVKDSKGQTTKTYGVNQDITERKRAEEEIKLAKERYELVARATNDAIYEWDIVNNVNYWGGGYETLFGYKTTGDKMPSDTWSGNLHPDEKENLIATAYEAFQKNIPSLTRELRFKCADGSYKTVFDKLIILYDNNRQPLKIVGAMQDITERKQNETAIQTLNEQLNKRAEELADSNAELERFAYIASHDLQEPLRMVSSFLQLLQKKYNGQLDETANQYIGFSVDGAARMKRLIFDLLEYSRVGSNRDILSDTNVGEEINEVLSIFESTIKQTNAVIKIQPMPIIKANKTQIAQLFQNLIGNALKYNNSPIPVIEIGYKEKNNAWEFYIKDNGIGIDKKFFSRIFIIFQRLHNRNQFSGTGVGLAICKKIVEKHGGTIWIESAAGTGSTFFFTIKK